MELEGVKRMNEAQEAAWRGLLESEDLRPEAPAEYTVLAWDGDELIATGARDGCVLKYLATAASRQGEGLSAAVVTALRKEAFSHGLDHLFLYTKPKNRWMFEDLFFYGVARTEDVLLMENRRNGVADFVSSLALPPVAGVTGAAVMNCDPFTLGHRYLIETAARECQRVYVFVLSEERGHFPAADRLELVRRGTADLQNVVVCPTGPYLISQATFPTYFLRDKADAADIKCRLDMEIFAARFAPALGITRRYVGTEPLSPVTAAYNRAMESYLPPRGIEVREIRRRTAGEGPVSASEVRALLGTGREERLRELVPETTLQYLRDNHLIYEED